ncbi:hypothetical protein GGI20_005173, partial [Coemansia sp. BCRC 34301]
QQTKSQLRNQHNGPRPKDQQQQQQQQGAAATAQDTGVTRFDDDSQRQGVLDKMRQENRERKKRWREMNDERNKDNDLRCRVNKRANQLYGAHASADKERWVGEEFERRQQRRRIKETRKRPQEEGEGLADVMPMLLTHSVGDAAAQIKSACMDVGPAEDAPVLGIPTGFGSYASLPTHQVRAVNDFWKNVAGHHALEAVAGAPAMARRRSDRPPMLTSAVAQSDASTLVASSPELSVVPGNSDGCSGQIQQKGVWLPPLSSVVPEEFRQPLVRPATSASTLHLQQPMAMPAGNPSNHVAHAASHAHMRPWEDDICPSLSPLRSATATLPPLSSLHLYWDDAQSHQRDDVAAGLSEAAFSLMSLSSSSGMMY